MIYQSTIFSQPFSLKPFMVLKKGQEIYDSFLSQHLLTSPGLHTHVSDKKLHHLSCCLDRNEQRPATNLREKTGHCVRLVFLLFRFVSLLVSVFLQWSLCLVNPNQFHAPSCRIDHEGIGLFEGLRRQPEGKRRASTRTRRRPSS